MLEINKIYCENNLETMSRMQDNFIDLTVTSPPYDNLRTYEGFEWDFKKVAQELFRITKQGGVVVWVVGDATINGSETGTSFKQALYFKEIGFNLHDTMIYGKNFVSFPSLNRYNQVFEYMFIFSNGCIENFNLIKDKKNIGCGEIEKSSSQRNKNGVLSKRKVHTTQKYSIRNNIWNYNTGWGHTYTEEYLKEQPAIFSLQLAKDHIYSWSNEGDLVYDCFMGSGTTAIACLELNRNFIGSEISQKYVDLANKRIELYKSQLKCF